jgi:glycosyltransferase involved in cell wall biosynthesis
MPKISIITPIYCDISAKVDWLDEAIGSVINQTIADWELILINDKSPLPLDRIKMKYATDTRLRWLENVVNEGPAKTRNRAVTLAESECILPLDSDDMLADNEVLEFMYDAWLMDKTKTIYGNVQVYKLSQNGFERSKTFQLAHYSFEGATNLEFGIMPVTTMHSKEAHLRAGGWKSILAHGREDLEYWIACGKAGFCGHKINYTTLLYRKHEESRDYKLKFKLNELTAMQRMIKDMHSDVYKGVFPMACCGKGKVANTSQSNLDPTVLSQQNQAVTKITELPGYDEKDLEWIAYQGGRKARFDILARGANNLPSNYTVFGTGHFFQIHKAHHKMFSDRQHLGFKIDQPDPRQQKEPEPVVRARQPEPQIIGVAKSELSTLVRLDKIGFETREIEIVNPSTSEIIVEPNPADSYSDMMVAQMPTDYLKSKSQADLSVSNLGLSKTITKMLDHNRWTIEKLAETTPEKLAELPGIALKRGQIIIDKAKGFMANYE